MQAGVTWRGERLIETLGPDFWDPVEPARFPAHMLRWRNDRAAAEVGLDRLDDAAWIAHFARFEPLPDTLERPLALRYHGHQFRVYNPDLGDGRGFTFAQGRDAAGRLRELGTKGSGQTPWSRFGDGRLTLKGAVRELLATEMLEALGVETSRTLSIVETGEALHRNDEPSPTRSAVLVRLSRGHVRIGSFQRQAALERPDNVERLARYVLAHLAGEKPPAQAPALAVRLLDWVADNTARLAAAYMAAGFVHGVLNSDNINVTGESFDYGPWRWLPTFEPGFTAAYFDHGGLYAYGRQPEAIAWDLLQLARCLLALAEVDALNAVLADWPARYHRARDRAFLARLGLRPRSQAADRAAWSALVEALATGVGFDRALFDWRGGRARRTGYQGGPWAALAAALEGHEPRPDAVAHPYWDDEAPCTMLIDEVEALWAAIAERDDWGPLMAKVAAIRRMGEAMR
jgi:uncharacterized protein YdiU (UPF0061 family)